MGCIRSSNEIFCFRYAGNYSSANWTSYSKKTESL